MTLKTLERNTLVGSSQLFGTSTGGFRTDEPHGEQRLAALAVALGALSVGDVTRQEADLLSSLPRLDPITVRETRDRIDAGADPLGEAFCAIRSKMLRRANGAVLYPSCDRRRDAVLGRDGGCPGSCSRPRGRFRQVPPGGWSSVS